MLTQVTRKSMTPQEKAKELFDKYADEFNFDDTYRGYREQSKQCALIVVDEIINYLTTSLDVQTSLIAVNYWQEVKQEIEKL